MAVPWCFIPAAPCFVSAIRGAEKAPELAAGGIKGSLLLFTAVIEERAAILDHFEKLLVDRPLSQGWIVVEVANELPAECPHIVDVFLNRFRRQLRGCQVFKERAKAGHQLLAGRQIFFNLFPAPSTSVANYSDRGSNVQGRDVAQRWRGLSW